MLNYVGNNSSVFLPRRRLIYQYQLVFIPNPVRAENARGGRTENLERGGKDAYGHKDQGEEDVQHEILGASLV